MFGSVYFAKLKCRDLPTGLCTYDYLNLCLYYLYMFIKGAFTNDITSRAGGGELQNVTQDAGPNYYYSHFKFKDDGEV